MRVFPIFLSVLLFACPAKAMVVAELFTSQGCVNSYAAEDVFAELAKEGAQDVVLLSCHVTGFDTEEWKDSLSGEFCDERQEYYEDEYDLYEALSLPQLVINGFYKNKGNDLALVKAGLEMARTTDKPIALPMKLEGEALSLTLPDTKLDAPIDVWILAYEKEVSSKIALGERTGGTLTHINPVTAIEKLAEWDGGELGITIDLKEIPAQGYVVMAQVGGGKGGIVAAGKAER